MDGIWFNKHLNEHSKSRDMTENIGPLVSVSFMGIVPA
jgi:hypothetical protein